MDGIEAANQIHPRFNIPVTYLTAYLDNNTLPRTEMVEPINLLLKPVEEKELKESEGINLMK